MGYFYSSALWVLLGLLGAISAQTDCNQTLDVVFVMDGSNSINPVNFAAMVNAVQSSVANNFSMGEGQTRVGAVIFGTPHDEPYRLVPLTYDRSLFLSSLQSMKNWPDGTTETNTALLKAMTELMTSGRTGVPKAIVVMTDGFSNNDVMKVADDVKRMGITIFSVGVGYVQNRAVIEAMATNKTTDVLHSLRDFDFLVQRLLDTSHVLCPEVCRNGIDLMLVLDGSNSVTPPKFQSTLQAVQQTVRSFWASYPNAKIGFLVYASAVGQIISPTTNKTAFDNVTSISYPNSGTNTAAALLEATRQIMASPREGMSRAIVIITDGGSDNRNATIEAANAARAENITVLAIGVGPMIDTSELSLIGDGRNSYVVDNFTALVVQLTSLVSKVCTGGGTPMTTNRPPIGTPLPTAGPTVNPGVCSKTVDVIFLVDSSNDVGAANFVMMTSAVSRAAGYFVKAGKKSRVGVILYSSSSHHNISINSDVSIVSAIQNLPYLGGTRQISPFLRQAAVEVINNTRPGVPFVVIVLISGPSDSPTSAVTYAQLLIHQAGASVYVLEITNAVNVAETRGMTGNEDNRRAHADTYSDVDHTLLTMLPGICQTA